MLLAGLTATGWGRRRGALGLRPARRLIPALAVLVALSALALWLGGGAADAPPAERPDLEVSVLDVGQGDAILFEPARADPVLVDGGPPGAGLADQLDAEGVVRLGAVVLSHDALDHAGGLTEALPGLPVDALAFATAGPETLAAARAAGARLVRVAAGGTIRSGALRLDVLWPPRELVARPPGGAQGAPDAEEQNARSVVALARWPGFSMLLSADAEAESVPIDPGPVDVLKVAHHGSEDAGLGRLLGTAVPRLGVIAVGEGNPYGHPTPATLDELERHGVPVLRTDLHGQIEIAVENGGWTVRTGVD
jgi:competence protein ComEC